MRVNRVKRLVYIALLLLVALCAPLAQAFDSAWTQKAVVTLDATYIDEAPVIVPIYLSGFDSTWWAAVQADGDDIRVTEDDETTERDYVLWKIDTGTSTGLIVVNVDGYASASVDVDLVVFAGNAGASAGSTTDTFSSTGYVGVYAPGVSTTDYSGNGRTLTAVNSPGTAAVSALEMDAATYNGSSSYNYNASAFTIDWPLTLEAVSYASNESASGAILVLGNTANNSNLIELDFAGSVAGDPIRSIFVGTNATGSTAVSSLDYAAETIYYIAGTRDDDTGTARNYVNGAADGTNATTIVAPSINVVSIGVRYRASINTYLAGAVAYAAISDEVRSADYIATMYDAWFTSAFRTYGATEANGGGATGHPWFYWRYH